MESIESAGSLALENLPRDLIFVKALTAEFALAWQRALSS